MKFKGEENSLIWEAFNNKKSYEDSMAATENPYDTWEPNDEDEDEIEYDDVDMDMGMEDDLGMEPEPEGMVMEIDPVAPVEAHEVNEVLVSDLKKLAEYAQRLYDMKDSADFEDWMVQAITIASTYVSDVWHRLDAKADFANTGFEQADDFQQF